jgi:hypothetical protein
VEGDRVMVPSGAVWANHAGEWMLLSPRIETGSKSIMFGGSAAYVLTRSRSSGRLLVRLLWWRLWPRRRGVRSRSM